MFDPIEAEAVIRSSLKDISADAFGLLGVVALFVALALAKGKDTVVALLFAIYPATLLTSTFPWYAKISLGIGGEGAYERLIVFIIGTIAFFFILRGYIESYEQYGYLWRVVEAVALSVALVGLTMATLYHVVQVWHIYEFSVIFSSLFGSSTAFFLWLIAPVLAFPMFVRS
jgi:hypothetical protein